VGAAGRIDALLAQDEFCQQHGLVEMGFHINSGHLDEPRDLLASPHHRGCLGGALACSDTADTPSGRMALPFCVLK
jgi:hypothetical protein